MTSAVTTLSADRSWASPSIRNAEFRAWLEHARPGARLEYYRGLLASDRISGSSTVKEAERRRLAALADQAWTLANRGKLHLFQERHGDGDYSYWAVATDPTVPLKRRPICFPDHQRPKASLQGAASKPAIPEIVKERKAQMLQALGPAVTTTFGARHSR